MGGGAGGKSKENQRGAMQILNPPEGVWWLQKAGVPFGSGIGGYWDPERSEQSASALNFLFAICYIASARTEKGGRGLTHASAGLALPSLPTSLVVGLGADKQKYSIKFHNFFVSY